MGSGWNVRVVTEIMRRSNDCVELDHIAAITFNIRSTKPVLDWANSVFGTLVQPAHHVQPAYTPLGPAPGRPVWTDSPRGRIRTRLKRFTTWWLQVAPS